VNRGGNIPDLSHISWYGFQSQETIPEPTMLTLVGIGLLGAGASHRRRRQ
jgi:hypothetical protein